MNMKTAKIQTKTSKSGGKCKKESGEVIVTIIFSVKTLSMIYLTSYVSQWELLIKG